MRSSSAAAPRGPTTFSPRRRAAISRASISPWSSCTPTPRACWTAIMQTAATSPPRTSDVIVIGGGDTGTDCVGTALRHGCKSLLQLEIVPMPPPTRAPDNPWPQWPKVYRLDYGQEEAKALWGEDPRKYADPDDQVRGRRQRSSSKRSTRSWWNGSRTTDGRCRRNIPGTEKTLPAQLVLLGPRLRRTGESVARSAGRGEGSAHECQGGARQVRDQCAKHLRGGRHAARDRALVVWAINEGRGAARECDRYLMGETALP